MGPSTGAVRPVTAQIVSDLNFLAAHYFTSPAYQTVGGKPVVYFFSVDTWAQTYGKTIDWTSVQTGAQGGPLPPVLSVGAGFAS